MLRLIARRALAQWPLLAAVLMVVVVGATFLGTCVLLVTSTAERALESAAARGGPDDVDVTAYAVTIRGPDAEAVVADTRAVLTSTLAPFPTTTTARASSAMRVLPAAPPSANGLPAQAYLSGVDDLPSKAVLTTGRWPRKANGADPQETVVFESTARRLGLVVGGRVHLGEQLSAGPAGPVELAVVGIARPLPGAGWDRDPLAAAGFDLAYPDSRTGRPVHAYGPFVVELADLFVSGSTVDRMEVTAHPDFSAPNRRGLDTVAAALPDADRLLTRVLGDRVQLKRIGTRLSATLRAARDQQRVTTGTVLAVALLGVVLTATALALAGRLTAGVRADEAALLSAWGFSRRQLAAAAVVEAGAVAVLATALAIPASSTLHAGLTHLPPLTGAGLTAVPGVTAGQVLVVACGALSLAVVLVFIATHPVPVASARHQRRDLLLRSGADVLLVVFAVVGWWQLRTQPVDAASTVDAVRLFAPATLLVAGAALVLRPVSYALRGADRFAQRARGLVFPLAVSGAARRPQAVAAGLLIGLACAGGSFAIAFDATWQRSQHDQADLSVGTDFALTLAAPPVAGQGTVISDATGGEVSPAVDRGVAVGQWLGGTGETPRLIAIDTTRAGALLRGGSTDWNRVGAALSPPTRATGIEVPAGAALTLTGTATGATPLAVTPRLLLQDATGLRTTCTGPDVPLDGKPHPLPPCATVEDLQLVAVSLPIAVDPTAPGQGPSAGADSRVAVTLTVPGAAVPDRWSATSAPPMPGQLTHPTAEPAGNSLRMSATVRLGGPEAAHTLVATAFPVPAPVPVAVSGRFAEELGVHSGSKLAVTVGTIPVPIEVVEVVAEVPSAPGAVAILADVDALSRAVVVAGGRESPVDAWWVGHPTRADAEAWTAALHLGVVTTRAGETVRLSEGPLRAALPAALRLLVPAAALLLLGGVLLHVTYDLRARALEVARLRALGVSRRQIRAVLLGQHFAVLLPLFAAGMAVGALATRMVAPLLIRSDTGAAPIPAAVPHWPWPAEGAFAGVVLAACMTAVTIVVSAQSRRADAAYLRVES